MPFGVFHVVFLFPEESFGLSLPLGEEYERKKQKLKQELRLDYRRFVSEVQCTPLYIYIYANKSYNKYLKYTIHFTSTHVSFKLQF